MVREVKELLKGGLSPAAPKKYGLEYKFVVMYLGGELEFDEMFRLLNIAIHQFAKRQMTWFRKMERSGISIRWLPEEMETEEKIRSLLTCL